MAHGIRSNDSVETALKSGDYDRAQTLVALKLARLFDSTESARDAKAISRELRLAMADMRQAEDAAADNPLAEIMRLAEQA